MSSYNGKINNIKKRTAMLLSWSKGIGIYSDKTKTASSEKGSVEEQVNLDGLRRLARDFKLAGEDELAEKISCAISALAGTEDPKTEYSYSYIMRKLRAGDPERRFEFQKVFKDAFDQAMDEDLQDPEQIALMAAIRQIEFSE